MSKLLGNRKTGLAFVLSAPAGTGKTTLVKMLVQEFPCVVESISHTTRPQREGEIHGEHYYFVTREEFERLIAEKAFLEYVTLYGDYYGTTYASLEQRLHEGKHVVLVIDTQGALQLKNKFPAVFIFVMPPSLEVLQQRLIQRKTENSSVIERRLEWATSEIKASQYYDYCLVNDDLSIAYQALRSIIIAEEHRITNQGDNYGTKRTKDSVD